MADEARVVLLEEACRAADRLDRLDAILRVRGEVYERLALDGTTVILVVDQVLAEARQQASALRLLVASLPIPKSGDEEPPGGDNESDPDAWMSAQVRNTPQP